MLGRTYCAPGGITGLKIWQVDAFTSSVFSGNPAAVISGHEQQVTDAMMQKIAAETNMPITTFFLYDDIHFNYVVVKWFTPTAEIPLCGHGTLALAHVYFTELATTSKVLKFNTARSGFITVERNETLGLRYYRMNFPFISSIESDLSAVPPHILNAVAGHTPISAHRAKNTWMLVYSDERIVKNATIFAVALSKCPPDENRLIITAQATSTSTSTTTATTSADPDSASSDASTSNNSANDFVSRVFHFGLEDAVCGSAHCTLAPYWSNQLGKTDLTAYQASSRGGTLHLQLDTDGNKLYISGTAVTFSSGSMNI